jgi:PAS domain S-box-containing protein
MSKMNKKPEISPQALGLSSYSRDALKVTAVSLIYFLAHQLAFFFPDSENIIMLVWPAGGVGLAAFLLLPKRLWPALTIAFYISGILADVFFAGRSFMTGLGYMTGNMVESVGCAWLILYFSKKFQKFARVREVLALLAGVVFVNAFSSCIGAGTSVLISGADFVKSWQSWYIADGLGILLIGPFIIIWISDVKNFITRLNSKKIIEGIACAIVWSIVNYLIFYPGKTKILFEFHPYFLVAFLAWPAIRFGQRGVTFVLMLLFAWAIVSPTIVNGPSPWGGINELDSLTTRLLELQFFVAFMAIVGYLMAAGFDNLMRAEKELKESEEKYRNIYDNALEGMYQISLEGKNIQANMALASILGYNSPEDVVTSVTDTGHQVWLSPKERLSYTALLDEHSIVNGYECQFKRLDGNIIWVSLNTRLVRNKNGNKLYYEGFLIDVTERRLAEQKLIHAKEKTEESEERFRAIFENSQDAIGISKKGMNVMFNLAYLKMFGYENPNEIVGKPLFEQISPKEHVRIKEYISKRANEQEAPTYYETIGIRKNGEEFPFELNVGTYILNNQKYSIGIIRDITERKKAQLALQAITAKLETIIQVSPLAITLLDLNGNVQLWNKAAEQIFGWTAQEIMGKPNPIVPFDKQNEFFIWFYQIQSGKPLINQEAVRQRKDGSLVNVSISSASILHNNNMVVGQMAIIADITRQKQAEEELIHAKEKAEESDRLKSSFLQNMSHEVRTPLNAISGFSQIITHPNLSSEKLKKFSEMINNSSNKLIEIISDVIDISQIQANLVKPNLGQVDIIALIKNIARNFEVKAKQKNIELKLNINIPQKELNILTDSEKIKKIFTHLIDNALKFTIQGYVEIICNLVVEHNCASLQISITDTGIGISDEMQKVIFEPFRQVETGITRSYGGNGLGLPIAKTYAELLNGSISLKSEINQGTTITVSIPVIISNIKANQKEINKQVYSINTILIAEDEYTNYQYLVELLEETGLKILYAKNGQQAIDLCRSNSAIDLILMDIKMPILDGHTAAKLIKAFRPELTIIAQTAYALESEKETFIGIFDDYITKPINEGELKEKLLKYMA